MNADQRFAILMVILAAVLGGMGWLLKTLLGVTQQWTRTGLIIENLTGDIRELVANKERDHARLDQRVDRVETRMERHEGWHAEH